MLNMLVKSEFTILLTLCVTLNKPHRIYNSFLRGLLTIPNIKNK